MGGTLAGLVVVGVFLVVGAPIALSIPGTRPDWTGLAFESALFGLLIELPIAIVLLRAGHYSWATALAATIAAVGVATFAIRRSGERRGIPKADLSELTRARPAVIGLGTLVLVGVAIWVRHAPSYFIFQTGDMGGYVNAANALRRAGAPFGTGPQGFTLFLRETNLVLGRANTVAGLPALGAMFALGAMAFARALKLHVAAAIAVGLVVLIHPVTVWFSLFPVSETLYATLLIGLLYLVVRARATKSPVYATLAGTVAGALLLTRGEAMLLAPIVVLVLFASAATDDDASLSVQRTFTIATLASLLVAYAYDVHYTHGYFRVQLRNLLPQSLSHFAEHTGLEQVSIPLVIVGGLVLAGVLWVTSWISRTARPRLANDTATFWHFVYGGVFACTALGLSLYKLDGINDTLQRWGAVLIVLAVLGLAGMVVRPGRYLDAVIGLLLLVIFGAYLVLFAKRVPEPKIQTYYLYYDRYLFSEALPTALPLVAVGVQMAIDALRRLSLSPRERKVAILSLLTLVVSGLVPAFHETRRATTYRMLGESYQTLHELDRLTRAQGTGAVVYSGSKDTPPNWFYPNTYRAFALPLHQSFGREVLGIPSKSLDPDDVLDPARAQQVLRHNDETKGYLVALRRVGQVRYPDDDHTRFVGSVDYDCPVLGQSTDGPPAPWTVAHLHFDVYALS